ncbi:hypothetical protein SAMN05518672_109198 [Chitinophaga sp. CF118]|nr:hypothetical protein SAMN05518672_109198 [Chitinophaga sp. CF118]
MVILREKKEPDLHQALIFLYHTAILLLCKQTKNKSKTPSKMEGVLLYKILYTALFAQVHTFLFV